MSSMILPILPDSCMVLFDNWRFSLNPLYTGSGTVCGWACNTCIVYYNQLYTRQTFCGLCFYILEYVTTHCNCFSHQSSCRVVGPHTLNNMLASTTAASSLDVPSPSSACLPHSTLSTYPCTHGIPHHCLLLSLCVLYWAEQ